MYYKGIMIVWLCDLSKVRKYIFLCDKGCLFVGYVGDGCLYKEKFILKNKMKYLFIIFYR